MLSINGTVERVTRDLRGAHPRIVKTSTVRALNRANGKVFTQAKRGIAAETGIAQKNFTKRMKKYGASRNRLRARTYLGLGVRIRLGQVNRARKVNGKWTKFIKRYLRNIPVESVFRTTVGGGKHTGFFVRTGASANSGGRDKNDNLRRGRLPIT